MASTQPVCVLDSGIGGLPYLEQMRELLPHEAFVYLSDPAGFPYGEKTPAELIQRLTVLMNWMRAEHNPKACVIACNTASVIGLDPLRRSFPDIPFIGVVPAVKPAARMTQNGAIGVLATQRTVEDVYVARLISRFAPDKRIELVAAGDLVRFIEEQLYKPEDPASLLEPLAARLHRTGVDTVVLGCTHFLHIAPQLAGMLGDAIHIVDSRVGVARQLQRVLNTRGMAQNGNAALQIVPWFTTAAPQQPAAAGIGQCFAIEPYEISL